MSGSIPPLPIFQLYRDGVPGAAPEVRRSKLARGVEELAGIGARALCMHGFPRELVKAWPGLERLMLDQGVLPLASWGLDGEQDNDKTKLTGKEKGECMAEVLTRPDCAAGLADAEGRWDTQSNPLDVTDEDDALAMGEAVRDGAPSALVGDQCWFAIDSHGEVRPVVPPADPHNVFRGFPVDEFARKTVNWFQFRQMYCNQADFKARWGRDRYERVEAWMNRDWARLAAPFRRAGLHYNPGVTIQGYGWDDTISDLAHCVLKYCGQLGQPLVVWCDWFPSPVMVAVFKAYLFLLARGYIRAGSTPEEMVRAYQLDFNRTAQVLIDTDGRMGIKTMLSMGIKVDA